MREDGDRGHLTQGICSFIYAENQFSFGFLRFFSSLWLRRRYFRSFSARLRKRLLRRRARKNSNTFGFSLTYSSLGDVRRRFRSAAEKELCDKNREVTPSRQINLCLRRFLIKETQMFCARFFVTLVSPKLLPFGNEIKNFGFCFAFRSLIRNFAGRKQKDNETI